MKKLLITGSNSYVGTNLEKWLSSNPDKYVVDAISLRHESWREKDFSIYDVVFHAAGIAHVSIDSSMEELYYKVNRDLTFEVATKAKLENVKQFIFMSSIIVYGDSNGEQRMIDEETVPVPSNFYGKSKLQAEEKIKKLESGDFKVVIVRPPMIYGRGSKGNYPKLSRLAQRLSFFPDMENRRSMLHIDNLCEFIRLIIVNEEKGTFFPQNKEYVKTSNMVKTIADVHGKKIRLTKVFNPVLKIMRSKFEVVNKVFGSLGYKMSMSEYKEDYRIRDFKHSILLTEKSN